MQRLLAGLFGNVLTQAGIIRWGVIALLGLATLTASAATPPNDAFASAIALTGAQSLTPTTGNNTGATKEPGEPEHVGDHGGASLWYSWTATFDGQITFN